MPSSLPSPATGAEALLTLAARAHSAQAGGDIAGAIAALEALVREAPHDVAAWTRLGVLHSTRGAHADAVRAFAVAAAARPDTPATHYNLGRAQAACGLGDAAAASFERACRLAPTAAAPYLAWAQELDARGRPVESLAVLERAAAAGCDDDTLQLSHAAALQRSGQHARAAERYARIAVRHPGRAADAHYGRGLCMTALEDRIAAVAAYDAALEQRPGMLEALVNRGLALLGGGDPWRASADLAAALELAPQAGPARRAAGCCALALGQVEQAADQLQQALRIDPDDAEAWEALGDTHSARRALLAADESYRLADAALVRSGGSTPRRVAVLHKRLDTLFAASLYAAAGTCAEQLAALAPEHPYLPGLRLFASAWCASWDTLPALRESVLVRVAAGEPACEPFPLLAVSDDPGLQQAATRAYVTRHFGASPPPAPAIGHAGRLRLGYLSPDFRDHPVGHLIAGTLERHDRSRFEVLALSSHPITEQTGVGARIRAAVDHFEDISRSNDAAVVAWARQRGVDVLIDLAAHTAGGRPGILAARAAPIQVSFLGYPGTYGANFVDYLIADESVVPATLEWAYDECIARLPGSAMPPGDARTDPPHPPSRAELGFPADALVLAAFHNTYKVLPEMYAAWMRLLRGTPRALLWLSRHEANAARALKDAARAAGVDPARIHFADRVQSHPEHLGRLAQADLLLDTYPYNAHSSAADALWAGVPVITCRGRSYASRVCGGLLATLGLAELVTGSLDEYEQVAAALLARPGALAALKARLQRLARHSSLFDSWSYTQNLEAAYETMAHRARRGEPPVSFRVEP